MNYHACVLLLSQSIYHRSIIIYLDRHVIFAFLCTLWTVDHTWQTVDHYLPVHAFFSKHIFFIHPLWCMNGRSLCTLPTKGGPFSLIVDSSLQVDPIPPSFNWFSSPHPYHPPPHPHTENSKVFCRGWNHKSYVEL